MVQNYIMIIDMAKTIFNMWHYLVSIFKLSKDIYRYNIQIQSKQKIYYSINSDQLQAVTK